MSNRQTGHHTMRRGALLMAVATACFVATVDTSGQRAPVRATTAAPADAKRPVVVNHTVPRVTAPSLLPVFSEAPTDAELRAARVFAEPLLPLGPSRAAENGDLAAAVAQYAKTGKPFEIRPFVLFLEQQPSSVWRASLQANLGGLHRASGYYTRALRAWDEAWALSQGDRSVTGRAVADFTAGQALDMLASMGQVAGLDRWLDRVKDRAMSGPAATKAERAREVRALIAKHPERVIPSGPKAIEILLGWRSDGSRLPPRDAAPPVPAVLKDYRPTAAGTTLAEVRALAGKAGMPLKAVRRDAGAPLVTPAIVHLGFDHFSAVLEERNGMFRLRDPALGGEIWMPRDALDEEMSGAALIPATADAPGWRELSDADAAAIVGHSCPPGLPDPDECPCKDSEPGMPVYSLHPVQASVLLADAPLEYATPRGPSVHLQLRYNHREENQPQTFTFANLGPRWTLNWLSYAEEVPFTVYDGFYAPPHVAVHVPQGGVERFAYADVNGVYPRHFKSGAVLVQTSTSPLTYERRLTDGSREVYAVPDGGVEGQRRVFLSSVVDPNGQTLTFTWDALVRLAAVTDGLDLVTTLQYEDGDPLKVTSVTDPFGRTARLTYDADGHLASVTDVINLKSSFTYANADFIAALQTPYGLTTFRTPAISGENARAVEATDPLGAVERLEFWWQGAPVPASVPADQVPPGFDTHNAYLDQITSLHWGKGRNVNNVQEATVWRWLIHSIDYYWDPGWSVGVPHSIQPIGEARTWYNYTGSTARPSTIACKLPDGSVYEVDSTYNYQDNVTWRKDPVGREMTYTYDTNGVDLLEVKNTTAGRNDVLAAYADYTAGHQPQTITDAAGQVTHMTYNGAGQALMMANAKQEQSTYGYDANGYLRTLTGPMDGATITYAYDAYGRQQSATPAGEAVVTTAYDPLNRPTRVTYGDGTYEAVTYDKLDVVSRRDRAGRVTRITYDSLRRMVASRDPAGRTAQQQWCPCGVLNALIDANGHATRWERNAAGRVLREVRADGVTATVYTYDAMGRLATVTDPKEQITTYTYNLDGVVGSVAYTNAQITTPGVTWTYDPAYARVTTMADGTGSTAYTYHPVGELGAGQVGTVDGPLTDDVISYTYDQLGRIVTRAIDGVPLTYTYDPLGRVQTEANVLGTFTYTYDGVSGRLATVTYPNNQTSAYSYFPAAQDHRLQQILHRYPNGNVMSQFDYTYDAVGSILTWRQQADTTAVMWEYGYDNADQLTRAVKRATDPQGTILQRFAYGYDPAGNRLYEQIDDSVTSWTYDNLNRLATQQAGGILRVAGTVNEPATVRVNGQPANVDASGQFVGGLPVPAGTTRFTIAATDASGNTATASYDVDQAGTSHAFTFDANGNLVSDGIRNYTWDARNQLVSVLQDQVTLAGFAYDGAGRRVRKSAAGTISTFLLDGSGVAEERTGDIVRMRYFDGYLIDQHVASQDQNGTVSYYASDHLGSVVAATDASGVLTTTRGYDPFGTPNAGSDLSGYAYTGRAWDAETGLYYNRARYYSPSLAAFVSEDPIRLYGGLNLYSYTGNNPTNWTDSLGLQRGEPGSAAAEASQRLLDDFMKFQACADKVKNEFNFLSQAGAPRYAHCMASCNIAKRCGGRVNAAIAGYGKEILDLASCLKTGSPGSCNTAMQPSDFEDNKLGRSCPADKTCEEQCKPLDFFGDGPPGPFFRRPFVRGKR